VRPLRAGSLTLANALFTFFMIACHPAFRGTSALDDPWGGSKAAEEEVGAFLALHPELLAQAAAGLAASGGSGGGAVVSPNPFRAAVTDAAPQAVGGGGGGGGGGSFGRRAEPADSGSAYDANPFK
jgi:hypothetical protein